MTFEWRQDWNPNVRPIEENFRTEDGHRVDGSQCVFPIVRLLPTGDFRPVGTGFFIANNGLFATARHVLYDTSDDPTPSLQGLQIMPDGSPYLRDIIDVSAHDRADVAIGFLRDHRLLETGAPTVNQHFVLTSREPNVGQSVISIAFPADVSGSGTKEDPTQLRFYCKFIHGTVEEFWATQRDGVMLRSRCFQTSMVIPPAASGGPVAFSNLAIFGINSSGFDPQPVGFLSSVRDLFGLEITNVDSSTGMTERLSVKQLIERGYVRCTDQPPLDSTG